MDAQSLTLILVTLQRIVGIFIGGLLVYFGYRLFLSLGRKGGRESGAGEFSLGAGKKVKLSKVGPGVFFAIFGAQLEKGKQIGAKAEQIPSQRKGNETKEPTGK